MNLRLLGAPTIKDIVPEMVDAHNIHSHVVAVPGDRLYDANCEWWPRSIEYRIALISMVRRREHAARQAAGREGEVEAVSVDRGGEDIYLVHVWIS